MFYLLQRRTFLKDTLASSVIAMAATSGLLTPGDVLGNWNKTAFNATRLQSALKSALGSDLTEASDQIIIQAPEIAENAAFVPVTVLSKLKNTEKITLFSVQNRTPLVAQFKLNKDTHAYVSTRIKVGKTSNLIAIITAGGKHYSTRKEIKVLTGGFEN